MGALTVVWHPDYEVDIGPHVFPTQKYRLVRDRIVADGTVAESDFVTSTACTDDQVLLVHTQDYVQKIETGTLTKQEELILEVPFSAEVRDAMWLCNGGSILAGRIALEKRIAVHLGGGFHHAFPDHGEGFCLVNDVAIAVRVLHREELIGRAIVIDLDVHHGNGTAAIFANDTDVFTFSMHQERNYPGWKPPSDLDLGLEDGTDDETYLTLLGRHLPDILSQHKPDVGFYLAGADPYKFDQLGGLGLTSEGLRRRDDLVFRLLRDAGVPVAVTLAGGYALNRDDTVEIHSNTVREAANALRRQDA